MGFCFIEKVTLRAAILKKTAVSGEFPVYLLDCLFLGLCKTLGLTGLILEKIDQIQNLACRFILKFEFQSDRPHAEFGIHDGFFS